jgi:hypothetical protein
MAKKPSYEELERKVQELEKGSEVTFKVGDKGGISAYLGGRFPVTLYVEQWERLIASIDNLRAFIKDNSGRLKRR